jgi:HEAT repeat protein
MKNPAAVTCLMELLGDDVVCGHAVMALGNLRAKPASERITPFLNHPKEWIRQEARKALASIVR